MKRGKGPACGGRQPEDDELIRSFLLDRQLRGCTPATAQTYEAQLVPLARWCKANRKTIVSLTEADLRAFLVQRGTTRPTLYAATTRIRTLYRWAAEQGVCANIAARIARPRQPHKIVPSFTVQHVKAMLRRCDRTTFTGLRDETLVRFLLDSGARISEALDLTLDRLDLHSGRATVNGKGQRQRYLFLGSKTVRCLAKYLSARQGIIGCSDRLFVCRDGSPMTRRHAHSTVARLAERAEVREVRPSPHTFRHTFACLFLQRGGDALALQRLLGHSSLSMTKRYLNMQVDDLAVWHRRASPGEAI